MATNLDFQLAPGLPASPDTERSILGAILLDNQAMLEARRLLLTRMFTLDSHRRIFTAMCALDDAQAAIDIVTLAQWLIDHKQIETVGGVAYLASLTENLPRRLSIAEYLDIVREKADLRGIISAASEAMTRAADQSESAAAVLDSLQTGIAEILDGAAVKQDPAVAAWIVQVSDEIAYAHTSPEQDGLSYGVYGVDGMTGGMYDGEVTVVGARSGVGKSALLAQTTIACCRSGISVDIFSLEMTRSQFTRRLIAAISGVPFFVIRKPGKATEDQMSRIRNAIGEIAEWPLRIHDGGHLHLPQIVALMRLSIRRYGSRFIGVDYAQRVSAETRDDRTRVAAVSSRLAEAIKHEKAHLMLLSQLRKVDRKFFNKPPINDDLRESGQLENDAHVILLLHREYDEEQSDLRREAEIIVSKQRNGRTGPIKSWFDERSITFERPRS